MKKTALALGILSTISTPAVFAGAVTSEASDIILNTQGGLKIQTADKKFAFQLGGRMQYDANIYDGAYNFDTNDATNAGDTADNQFFRRVRIELKGTAFYDWNYELTPQFSDDNSTNIEYAWVGFDSKRLFGFDSLTRVGRYKPFSGLEELTSSKWIPLVERSTPTQFFNLGTRNQIGSQASFMDLVTVSGSYFREGANGEDVTGGDRDSGDSAGYSGRLTLSPIHSNGKVAHFGVSYQDRESVSESSRLRFRQEVRSADRLSLPIVGGIQRVDISHYGFEGLGIFGPVSLQGEYFLGELETGLPQAGETDFDVDGFNIIGRWTLTGESLPYDFKSATPGQIKPANPMGVFGNLSGPWGAFELVARYSSLEFDDAPFDLQVNQWAAGLNWYVNNNVKFALNYQHTDLDGATLTNSNNLGVVSPRADQDEGDAFVARAQFQF